MSRRERDVREPPLGRSRGAAGSAGAAGAARAAGAAGAAAGARGAAASDESDVSDADRVVLRAAKPTELPAAARLLASEGWSFTINELERVIRLGGSMAAFKGRGKLVGFLTYIDLDPVRWIGNVAVDPDVRGQGIGGRLVEATIAAGGVGRITSAGLYSVEKAVTLYERAGFAPVGEAFALRANDARARGSADAVTPMEPRHLPAVFRLDRQESGMDRRGLLAELLDEYPDHACVVEDVSGGVAAFGFAKPYDEMTELGPIVSPHPEMARVVLDALIDVTPGPHDATILGANGHALEMLRKRGFDVTFRTVPMFRGAAPAWKPASLLVAAGLEKS